MDSSTRLRFALASCAALLLLAGCSGTGSGVSPAAPRAATHGVAAQRSLILPDGSYPLGPGLPSRSRPSGLSAPSPEFAPGRLYVSDAFANAVQIYRQNGTTPIDSITNGLSGAPHGSYVDDYGTLYVTDFYSNNIVEYPRGSHTPSVTLTKGVNGPISVVVGEDGTIYVAEFPTNTVLEFAQGSTSPTATISINNPESVTLNPKNRNLYVSYDDPSGNGRVMRFPYGQTTGTDIGIVNGGSGQLEFDTQNNLALADQVAQVINIYPPGSTTPSRTISTAGHDPYHFALNHARTTLFLSDPQNNEVVVYDYASGTQIGTIFKGLSSAYGVAVNPDAPF